jgi:hypothetical protein
MPNTTTCQELKSYALWLSGEPTDGSSDYDSRILQHMQTVYDTLVNGGTLGVRDIATSAGLYEHFVDVPTTDWLWLKKFPPFAFNTVPAVIGNGASVASSGPPPEVIGTVFVANGSKTITFTSSPLPSGDLTGWRLRILDQAQGISTPPFTVPRINSHTLGSATAELDAEWPQQTQTLSNFALIKLEYALPQDFIRFSESPQVQGGWNGANPPRLSIGSYEQVNDQFPLTQIAQGPPSAAARLNTSMIMMNLWDTQSYRIEFGYIARPPALTDTAQEPLVPLRYRHMLSIGAAMMVMQDKVDSRAAALASEFREILLHMGNEYRKEMMSGSELMGRMLYRRNQRRNSPLRTVSGLPLW